MRDPYAWAQPLENTENRLLTNADAFLLKKTFAQTGNASTMHGKVIETALFRNALREIKKAAPQIFQTGLFYAEDTLLMGAVYALPETAYLGVSGYLGYFYNVRPGRGIYNSLEQVEQSVARARQTALVYDCLLNMYPGLGAYVQDRLLQAALQQIRRTRSVLVQRALCDAYVSSEDVPRAISREIEWHACQGIREL